MSISAADLTLVEVLLDGAWVPAHVRLQAGTADHPITVVNLQGAHTGDDLLVVASDCLRPCTRAA